MATISYTISHPQLGFGIIVLPGETPEQAIADYDAIYGEYLAELPVIYQPTPRWNPVYSERQLTLLQSQSPTTMLFDPDTHELISIGIYKERLAGYQRERMSPLDLSRYQ